MSLSPFDSFQSRFVTYLLNRLRIYGYLWLRCYKVYKTTRYLLVKRCLCIVQASRFFVNFCNDKIVEQC